MESSHERWLITGAGGQLGSVLMRKLSGLGAVVLGIASPAGPAPREGTIMRCDLTDHAALRRLVQASRPSHILHAAGVTQVQAAFEDPGMARRVNRDATRCLVELAAEHKARFLYTSTDLVFDGTAAPYSESSGGRPLSMYGRSKLEGEAVALAYEHAVVARVALMYGAPDVDRPTPFRTLVQAIRSRTPVKLFVDEFRTPIDLADAAEACLTALRSDYAGVLHVGGPERLSRWQMGRNVANYLGYDDGNILPIRQTDVAFPEPRPCDVSLDSTRFEQVFGHPPGKAMEHVLKREGAAVRG